MRRLWTNDKDDVLRREFLNGTSASHIASLFPGATRNAIVGRLHRLGLKRSHANSHGRRKFTNQEPSPRKIRSAHGQKSGLYFGRGYHGDAVAGPTDTTPLDIDPAPGDRVSLTQLTKKTCRWPLGDPNDEDFGFCGAKPHECLPYCLAHARVAYVSPQQQAQRRIPNGGTAAIDTGSWR